MTAGGRPAAIGPYSPVLRSGEWIVCSGQLGLVDGMPAPGAAEQTRLALESVARLLASEGADLGDVVKTTVFLADMGDFAAMNATYAAAFGEHRPARSAVGVAALPLGAQIEIEAWAHRPEGGATR